MKKREAALLVSLFCCISMAAQLPVLIQQKWNDATTAETLKRDFKLWRQKGVTGVCFDAGTDCDRIDDGAERTAQGVVHGEQNGTQRKRASCLWG